MSRALDADVHKAQIEMCSFDELDWDRSRRLVVRFVVDESKRNANCEDDTYWTTTQTLADVRLLAFLLCFHSCFAFSLRSLVGGNQSCIAQMSDIDANAVL